MNETTKFNVKNCVKLSVMAWNIGFGSRKPGFIASDADRADKIVELVKKFNIDAVALQEMANREYNIDLSSFNLSDYLKMRDDYLDIIHFQPTVSLGLYHSYPYGKLSQLKNAIGISRQVNGPGTWIRNGNNWCLRNLYADDSTQPAMVEVQRPLPHPLYMGEQPAPEGMEGKQAYSAGRDEEDRPVLWCRLDKSDLNLSSYKIYFLSLHLPTLSGEEKGYSPGKLNKTQAQIFNNVLRLPTNKIKNYTVDELGSELRQYFIIQVLAQVERIIAYWQAKDISNKCVFLLAGDFNFYHTTAKNTVKTREQILLENHGFEPAKKNGSTRPGSSRRERLIDNVWVQGAREVREVILPDEGVQIEKSSYLDVLNQVSDHYPVLAEIQL